MTAPSRMVAQGMSRAGGAACGAWLGFWLGGAVAYNLMLGWEHPASAFGSILMLLLALAGGLVGARTAPRLYRRARVRVAMPAATYGVIVVGAFMPAFHTPNTPGSLVLALAIILGPLPAAVALVIGLFATRRPREHMLQPWPPATDGPMSGG